MYNLILFFDYKLGRTLWDEKCFYFFNVYFDTLYFPTYFKQLFKKVLKYNLWL